MRIRISDDNDEVWSEHFIDTSTHELHYELEQVLKDRQTTLGKLENILDDMLELLFSKPCPCGNVMSTSQAEAKSKTFRQSQKTKIEELVRQNTLKRNEQKEMDNA